VLRQVDVADTAAAKVLDDPVALTEDTADERFGKAGGRHGVAW
jgi:hypothetical protein